MSFGSNLLGQCGHGEIKTQMKPKLIESLRGVNVIDVACGENHSIILTDTGNVYATGANEYGQIGVGPFHPCFIDPCYIDEPCLIDFDGCRIKKIGCGENFSVALDVDGHLHLFGKRLGEKVILNIESNT